LGSRERGEWEEQCEARSCAWIRGEGLRIEGEWKELGERGGVERIGRGKGEGIWLERKEEGRRERERIRMRKKPHHLYVCHLSRQQGGALDGRGVSLHRGSGVPVPGGQQGNEGEGEVAKVGGGVRERERREEEGGVGWEEGELQTSGLHGLFMKCVIKAAYDCTPLFSPYGPCLPEVSEPGSGRGRQVAEHG
jgi:hypothetical protein